MSRDQLLSINIIITMISFSVFSRVLGLFGIFFLAISAHADLTLRVSVNALIGPNTYYLDFQSIYDSGPGSSVKLDNFEVKPGLGFPPGAIVHGLTGPATIAGGGITGNLADGLIFTSTPLTPTNEYYQLMDNLTNRFGLNFDLTLTSPLVEPGETFFTIAVLDENFKKIDTTNPVDPTALAQFSINEDGLSNFSIGYYVNGPIGANIVVTPVLAAVPEPAAYSAVFCSFAAVLVFIKLRKTKAEVAKKLPARDPEAVE